MRECQFGARCFWRSGDRDGGGVPQARAAGGRDPPPPTRQEIRNSGPQPRDQNPLMKPIGNCIFWSRTTTRSQYRNKPKGNAPFSIASYLAIQIPYKACGKCTDFNREVANPFAERGNNRTGRPPRDQNTCLDQLNFNYFQSLGNSWSRFLLEPIEGRLFWSRGNPRSQYLCKPLGFQLYLIAR